MTNHLNELRRLYGKFREGTLTIEEALGGYILLFVFCPFFVIPIIALGFIDTEILVTDDKRVSYVTAFLFIFFFIMMMILLARSLPQKPSSLTWVYRVFGAIVCAVFFSYICGMGYFTFWNTVSGSGEKMLISGPVVHLGVGMGNRYTGKPRYITIPYNGRDIKLTVSAQEYAALSVGQMYYREMKLGGLGYYYNWGSSWWK